jgi:hypothetical protein
MVRKTKGKTARATDRVSGCVCGRGSLDGHLYRVGLVCRRGQFSLQHSDIVIAYSPPTLPYDIYQRLSL